jgi:hypothetical protein
MNLTVLANNSVCGGAEEPADLRGLIAGGGRKQKIAPIRFFSDCGMVGRVALQDGRQRQSEVDC